MLTSKRQNFHHSKLPKVGDIVNVVVRPLQSRESYKKFIVESFPLCDNIRHYSRGIHTCIIRDLSNNEKHRVSGHLLETIA
jgi:hypothetical protein